MREVGKDSRGGRVEVRSLLEAEEEVAGTS